MNAEDHNWLKRDAKSWVSKKDGTQRRCKRATFAREEVLKQWYGKKMGGNEIAAMRDNEVSIADIIPGLIKDLGIEEEGIYAIIFSSWQKIVGDQLKMRLFPVAVKGTCLHIETSDSATMYHMRQSFLKKTLLQKIKDLTDNKITELRFVPRGRA